VDARASASLDSPVPTAVRSVARGRLALGLLLAVTLPLLFTALDLDFLDPDEGLYGDVAAWMIRSGDWILPHFNQLPYLEKPPLYYWMSALTLLVDGRAEWPLRLGSALSALGSVLLVWRIGRRLYGPAAGVLAGIVLATTVGGALYVRKASTDPLFVFCLTLALYGFLRDAERRDAGRSRFLLFYAAVALGLLTKGLIGVAFPVIVVGAGLLWVRRLGLRDLNLGRGLAVVAAIALPWHLAVAWRTPELFWFYLVDNQVLRFLNARGVIEDDIPVSTLGFFLLSFVWFFPWSPFVLARSASAATRHAAWRPLVLIWALVVVLFFAASRSKLEYYALPAFPALAILVGAAWASARDVGRWLAVTLVGGVIVGIAAITIGTRLTPSEALAGLAALNVYYRILQDHGVPFPFASPQPFGQLLVALGVVLIAGSAAALVCWRRAAPRLAFAAVGVQGMAIAGLIVQLLYLVEPHHSVRPVAAALQARAEAHDVIAHEGSLEYSAALPFYTGRQIVVVNGTRGDLEMASRGPEAASLFLDTGALVRAWAGTTRIFLVSPRPQERSVVAALPAGSVHVVGQFGSRWLYSNRGI
jgi:4-amino-4-deoxy-L-arabinose transferase-like glycosyltransferase